ncbi:hypothetical protein I3271_20235 [Photobacterium leiognathi]|uniref:hypothetical protein n=1 Tax=Photobacterium leiognathi TaxID=553611 RepID=UPI001EDEB7AD|nr:hypothetical protein [Photobacterium leiognathi]MCG3887008.1 hypothetical protein [Photobacterium leiognathi]
MTHKYNKILVSMLLVNAVNTTVNAQELSQFNSTCQIPELETDLRNFQDDIADLDKIEFIASQPKNFEKGVNEKLPNFQSGVTEFANKFAAAISLSIGGFDLIEGIETGNTDKTTEGIVTISTYVAPEVAGEVIGTLFSESIADAVNPVTAVIVAEAMAINQAIKLASQVNKMIEADHNLMKVYENSINKTDQQLNKLKRIIVGDYQQIYNYEYNNFGEITVKLHQNSFETLSNRLMNDYFTKRIQYRYKKYDIPALVTYPDPKIGRYKGISSIIGSLKWVAEDIGITYFTTKKFVPYGDGIYVKLNNVNWKAYEDGVYAIFKSKAFRNAFNHAFVWVHNTLYPVLNVIVDKIYDDHTQIMNDFKTILTDTSFLNGIQRSMIAPYNKTIKKYVAWQEFGYQVLKTLDYTDAKTTEALADMINVLNPIIGAVVEIPIEERISNDVNLAPQVFTITKLFIDQKVDITDNDKFLNILNKWFNSGGSDISHDVYNKMIQARKKAADKYTSKLVSESDITLVPINQTKLNSLLKEIDKNIKNGSLKNKINTALKDQLKLKLPFGINNFDTSYRMLDLAQRASSIQNNYFKVVVDNINRTISEIENSNDEMFAATRISELRERLIAIHKNHNNVDYKSTEIHKYTKANFDWLTFNSTPYIEKEHQAILSYLDELLKNTIERSEN